MRFKVGSTNLFNFAYELYKNFKNFNEPIFLCVGSDKFVFDMLGPLVAEKLKKEYGVPIRVYGGLDFGVNASNLVEVVNYIETMHEGCSVILIDATLGCDVGDVVVTGGAFAGMGKCIPNRKIGALSVLGVVGRKVANFNLNSTSMKIVSGLADFIAKGCYLAGSRVYKERLIEKIS